MRGSSSFGEHSSIQGSSNLKVGHGAKKKKDYPCEQIRIFATISLPYSAIIFNLADINHMRIENLDFDISLLKTNYNIIYFVDKKCKHYLIM